MLTSQREKQPDILYLLAKSCQRNWTQIWANLWIWLPICRKYKRREQCVELHQKYDQQKPECVKLQSNSTVWTIYLQRIKWKEKDEEEAVSFHIFSGSSNCLIEPLVWKRWTRSHWAIALKTWVWQNFQILQLVSGSSHMLWKSSFWLTPCPRCSVSSSLFFFFSFQFY